MRNSDRITYPVKYMALAALRAIDVMARRKDVRRLLLVITASIGALVAVGASAQTAGKFVPSETEWAVWPKYCQARYVDIPLGQSTQFASRMSHAQISVIKTTVRPDTYYSIHHYCFGIGYMMRARLKSSTSDSTQYRFLLRSVVNEGKFTFQRMDLADPIAAEVAYLMATALTLLGESSDGVKLIERVIAAQPELPGGYVALALLYRSDDEMAKAVEIIELALHRVSVPSAELNYTAAIVYIEKSDLKTAQGYAIAAYDLGYPLPGLKRKLAKLGYWPPNSANAEAN